MNEIKFNPNKFNIPQLHNIYLPLFFVKLFEPEEIPIVEDIFSKIPEEERDELAQLVCDLSEIGIKSDYDGCSYNLPSMQILKKMARIPTPQKRTEVVLKFRELVQLNICDAKKADVLNFLIRTPDPILGPVLRVAKGAYFNKFGDSNNFEEYSYCALGLQAVSKIEGIDTLSEEQLQAFENLEVLREYDEYDCEDDVQSFLYKILFGNQESIRHLAFGLVKKDSERFYWMKQLIESSGSVALQTLFENSNAVHYFQSIEKLKLINDTLISNSGSIYIQNMEKPFPKNLVAKHSPETIAERKIAKKTIKIFLDYKFNSDCILKHTILDSQTLFAFELKKDKYRILTGERIIIKNEINAIELDEFEASVVEILLPDKKMALTYVINPKLLHHTISGSKIEKVNTNTEIKFECDNFWDDWENYGHNSKIYKEIDMAIFQVVTTILESLGKNFCPTILDVGGGSGRLANSILQSGSFDYILLEKNLNAIEKAEKTLGNKASIISTDIVKEPVYYRNKAKTLFIEQNSVDIAIGSGILAKGVLKDKNDALIVLKKISFYLKNKGFLILTGLTPSYITSSDLQVEGFEVINKSIPQSFRQFYIAQKV